MGSLRFGNPSVVIFIACLPLRVIAGGRAWCRGDVILRLIEDALPAPWQDGMAVCGLLAEAVV